MREERLNFELQRFPDWESREGYRVYFFADKNEYRETEEFLSVLYDSAHNLTDSYAVLYGKPYACRRRSKKRIFGGRRPARFQKGKKVVWLENWVKEAKGCVSAVQEYEGGNNWWFYWENKRDCKAFFILQKPFKADLLKNLDNVIPDIYEDAGWDVAIYTDPVDTRGENEEQTIERYRTRVKKALFFGIWPSIPETAFFIDPKLYPEEKLIGILKAAVEKHGYELEILPPMRVEEKKHRRGK